MSNIKYIPGIKADEDTIALINNHAVTYEEIAELVIHALKTEDLLYPTSKGMMGAAYFMMYLTEAMLTRKIPDRERWRFKD